MCSLHAFFLMLHVPRRTITSVMTWLAMPWSLWTQNALPAPCFLFFWVQRERSDNRWIWGVDLAVRVMQYSTLFIDMASGTCNEDGNDHNANLDQWLFLIEEQQQQTRCDNKKALHNIICKLHSPAVLWSGRCPFALSKVTLQQHQAHLKYAIIAA